MFLLSAQTSSVGGVGWRVTGTGCGLFEKSLGCACINFPAHLFVLGLQSSCFLYLLWLNNWKWILFFYQGDFKIIIRNAGSNNMLCIMLTRKWTCCSWVDFCACLDRETVGLPDLCWIWILPEHRFTQPAVCWLPSCVSTANMASKAHTFNCIFSCHSYCFFFTFSSHPDIFWNSVQTFTTSVLSRWRRLSHRPMSITALTTSAQAELCSPMAPLTPGMPWGSPRTSQLTYLRFSSKVNKNYA